MNQVFDIKPFNGNVRTSLCTEDIVLKHKAALVEFGIIEVCSVNQLQQDVSYLVFKDGYRTPYFNLFYAKKITGHTDPYLPKAILRLLYLNPGTSSTDNVKAITSFILSNFSATKKKASAVKDGKFVDVPVLDYEKVYAMVWTANELGSYKDYVPDTERIVMYPRDSKITKNQKISINAVCRAKIATSYYEKAIHNAAEFLHESQELIKITDSRIKDTDLVRGKRSSVSTRTITRYMAPRTKAMIEELNLIKPFKTFVSYKKYEEFLQLEDDSAEVLAEKLSVSKSTIFEFRKIKN